MFVFTVRECMLYYCMLLAKCDKMAHFHFCELAYLFNDTLFILQMLRDMSKTCDYF